MWISTKKVKLLFSHVRLQVTFSCLIPSQEKRTAELPTSPFEFSAVYFLLGYQDFPSSLLYQHRDRTLLGCLFEFKKPNLPPCQHWETQRKEKHFLTSKGFYELSRSFLFHREPQNKAGSDWSVWSWEISGTDTTECSMCHYPRDKFPPIYPPGLVPLFFGHIVLPLLYPSAEEGQHWGPSW